MKGKKQKLAGIILIAFIIFWSIYTHFNDVESLTDVEEESYTGMIKIYDYPRLDVENGSRYSWIQGKIKAFERKNPGVYIEFTPLDWKSGPQLISESMKGADGPDIIPISYKFDDFEKLEVLDKYFSKEELDEFRDEALKATTYDDKLIGIPFAMNTYVMYLNLDLFNERGVSSPHDGNWTYEEFVETLKSLTFDFDGDGLIDHYGFVSFVEPNYYNIWGLILGDGADILDCKRENYSFYGEEAVKGIDRVLDLKYKYEVTPEFFGIIGEEECWEMFSIDKNVAVYPTGSWAVKALFDLQNNGEGFNFDVANYPSGDEKTPRVLTSSIASFGIVKDEDIKKTEMCVKFLKFLMGESNQRTLEKLGLFSVKKGIDNMYMDNFRMKKIESSLDHVVVLPKEKNWEKIDVILQEELKKAILKEKSSKEAIEDAKKRVEELTR